MHAPAERSAAVVRALLAAGRRVRFRARGLSMAPAIRDGDEVEVAPADAAVLRRGAVVLYADAASRLTLHRLTDRDAATGLLLLRGDAVGGYDAPVAATQVLGRVVGVTRRAAPLADVYGPALVWPGDGSPLTPLALARVAAAPDEQPPAPGQPHPPPPSPRAERGSQGVRATDPDTLTEARAGLLRAQTLTFRAQRDAYAPLVLAHDGLHAAPAPPVAGTLALCAAGEQVALGLVLARRRALALVALAAAPPAWLPVAAVPARVVRVWDATGDWPLDRWPWRPLLGALAAVERWAAPLAAGMRALLGLHRRWRATRRLLDLAARPDEGWCRAGQLDAPTPAGESTFEPWLEPWEEDVLARDVPHSGRVLVAGPAALRLGLALAARGWRVTVTATRRPARAMAGPAEAAHAPRLVVQDLRAPGLRPARYDAILLTAGLYERLLGRPRRVALLRALAALLAPGGILAGPLDDLHPRRGPLASALRDGALWLLGRLTGVALEPGDHLVRSPAGLCASHAFGGPDDLRREAAAAGLAWRRFTVYGVAVVARPTCAPPGVPADGSADAGLAPVPRVAARQEGASIAKNTVKCAT
ncbi:MAG: S24/S26 family peptidase [Chloroflexi bacterium]|nr:S24/S26 family peptidase [Chloroflexota bacterium]